MSIFIFFPARMLKISSFSASKPMKDHPTLKPKKSEKIIF